MRFANSIRLLMENFKQVFKLLLYRLVIGVLGIALCCVFVLPELKEIATEPATQTLVESFKKIFLSMVSHDHGSPSDHIQAVFGENGNLKAFFDFILTLKLELLLVCLGCLLVYLLKRFADTLVYFTIGSTLNDRMATYSDTPFMTAFVGNLGKACAYAALYVPTVFVLDMATLAVCFLLLRFLPLAAALFLSVTLVVLIQSFKLTFTSPWMPAMNVDDKKLGEAIRYTSKREKRQVGKMLAMYVVTTYLILIFNGMAAVFTFGSALLITIPTSYFLLICQQYVNYYTMKGKKYFITYEKIETNPDHGDSEHFFEYIEAMEKEMEISIDSNETNE
ncbi:MAG: hypothetical protein E7371_05875 [Clostridiales bacterium]|nr:hypothetical protein [Clostridiales bacterium]